MATLIIHRMALMDGAQCGIGPDKFGHLYLRTTGVGVTCPDCNQQPDRAAQLATLEAAAARFRSKRLLS